MNKMTVIQLLNKIANGEEVPSKIEYRNKMFIYDKGNQCYIVENYNEYDDLLMSLSNHKGTDLNYEVEILEEPKGIPEKLIPTSLKGIDDLNEKIDVAHIDTISAIGTINEIIDYLESKGE